MMAMTPTKTALGGFPEQPRYVIFRDGPISFRILRKTERELVYREYATCRSLHDAENLVENLNSMES